MAIKNIDHFELVVSDIDKALDFYKKVGFEVKEVKREGSDRRRAFLRIANSQEVNVLTPADVKGLRRDALAGGGHFCVVVDQSMEALTEALARNGIAPRAPAGPGEGARGNGDHLFVLDPDGNTVELMTYPS